ncbi:hypothetical protein [Lysinibacillus sp. ZYM-1]|uniref:hypothetical protein n=1 Tax=Lysinibacillus sp. ZYM-1 TaxID=1681184 RepID=UPI0006CE7294|nr:hypothetical protein [Lysinibacillus sp. ZYM-1]KPN95073.1 hypothetical protein AO843_21480 [Lysinibacillus sp. ZYM-1]
MKSNMLLSVISIFLLLTLSACSQDEKEYNFYGTSNNWVVKYETEISEAKEWADFSFEYVGEEAAPEMFGYNLKSKWFELTSKEELFNHQDNINSGNSECTGPPINKESCAVIIKDDEIMEAKIEWNGNSEVIVLTRK